jgi:endoglucanase
MKKLLQTLTETFSPSGYEDAIREVIRKEVRPLADEVYVDALGNLIARKGKGGKKIMVAAHMDEIGIIVTHVDDDGFVRFTGVGGVMNRHLVGGRVRFMNGTAGVIGVHPGKENSMDAMFIDVGATSKKDCPVQAGDVAAFDRPFADLGSRWVAKAMDDRIGVLVGIETLRALKSTPNEVYFVFTTQEEIGTRGATTSAFGIDPDLGIALDVTISADTPQATKMDVGLGKGPAIKIKDGGMISDPRIVEWMEKTAEKAKMPYQREVLTGGTTDARSIQMARAGVPSGCISIPCRYVHSPSEMVDENDVKDCIKLLTLMLKSEPKGF